MIPSEINKSHILKAIQQIDKISYIKRYQSTGYDLIYDGKYYPPKYLISLAYKFIKGYEFPLKNFSGGVETNQFLRKLGFTIVIKNEILNFSELQDENEEKAYFEGKEKYELHRSKERDTNLSKDKKNSVMESEGKLVCEACDFDFNLFYGERGLGYIECHHNKPVSSLSESTAVRFEDLTILCSNCHRIIHRIKPWISVKDLKKDKVVRKSTLNLL